MLRVLVIYVVVAAAAVAAAGTLGACGTGSPGPGIDVDRALTDVEAHAFARPRDTDESARARAFIEQSLRDAGVPYEEIETGTVELPPIEVLGVRHRERSSITVRDPNILVRFGPRGPALLVMAHYDSVPFSPGACDNAAAVAILLELARIWKADPP